ncbi:carbon-nitrogen hydrolase family protein [Nocardia sp. NPDC005366]|uniref:carbon-nitrogen hydrolase family protein n=1 Tax=Nocardia sp. NPDC005366 TaxID=3156878 RepID=UPI0033B8ED61
MRLNDSPAHQNPAAAKMSVAVIQFAPGTRPSDNLAALREQVGIASERGAEVVVAPEYSMYAVSRLDERVVAVAEPLTGPFASGLGAIAAEYGLHLVAGMVEKAEPGSERIRNTLVAFDPAGTLIARYRKVHLYDAFGQRESDVVEPGAIETPATFAAGGVTFGMQTCFDLRFPEGFRRAAVAGAQVLLLPAQWIPGPAKVDQWTTLVRARAIENTVYVAAADQAAPRGAGASMIVDPAGRILAELDDRPGVLSADIDLEELAAVRSVNPSLALRRFAITERSAE